MHALEGSYKQSKTLKKTLYSPSSMQGSGYQNNNWQMNTKHNLCKWTLLREEFLLHYKHNSYIKKNALIQSKRLTSF